MQCYRELGGAVTDLPEAFVTAQDLPPAAHLRMQAELQPFVDSAISKTVNVPADCAFEEFHELYRQAYELGLKGCTTYRPSILRDAILETDAHCCSIEREGE